LEIPKDYVLDIIKQALYDKIDSTEYNLRNEIRELRNDIKEFNVQCKYDMGKYDKRIKKNEEFRIKTVAIAGATGVIAAFIFSRI